MANEKNLKPCRTTKEAKERGKKGGIASGKAKREKKKMTEIYAEFLAKTHNIEINDVKTKIQGSDLVAAILLKVLNRGDSASVSLLKELRESTEGSKIEHKVEGIEIIFNNKTKGKK